MKRSLFVVVPILLVACRGIVGIEDLTVADGGADAGTSGDSGARADGQAGQDASSQPDGGGPPDTGNGCSANAGEACLACCMQAGMTDFQSIMMNGGQQCLCNPTNGACKTECASGPCGNPPAMPSGTCGQCQTDAFLKPGGACNNIVQQCAQTTCKTLAACGMSCPP